MELPVINQQRREFFTQTLYGLGLIACGGILTSLAACEPFTTKVNTGGQATFDTVTGDPDGFLKTVGTGLVVLLKDKDGNSINGAHSVVIMRVGTLDKDEYITLSSRCDHEDCDVVAPVDVGENIICPCHNSQFSPVDGSLVNGPAKTSLVKFANSYDPVTKFLTIFA
ncbi:MAG: Rieske (2Fe-2S) protein [Ignavibacteriae bacterium]|nr:Rieske (2Fe-2S) protein [Ignavibacteriota bacterium]